MASPSQLALTQHARLVPSVADLTTNQFWPLHRPNAYKRLDMLGDKRFSEAFCIWVQPLSDAFHRAHGVRLSDTLKRFEDPKDLKQAERAREHLTAKIGRQFAKKNEEMLAERASFRPRIRCRQMRCERRQDMQSHTCTCGCSMVRSCDRTHESRGLAC